MDLQEVNSGNCICDLGYCPYADSLELTCDYCPHSIEVGKPDVELVISGMS